ncbi:outer membrane assembly lipoprotein YfgL [Moraxella catarrhalis 12P80B1]|nr:outer membrane protein assembly factor BamB [Moraxella catarrhalis]EGE13781.1 outer membrane assembly lipoprotein YfgL [Moraxella catarrhalis 12P80B1]
MYQRFINTALVAALAVTMAGCGTKAIKPTERKPAKLVNIQAPVAVLTQVSSVRLDQGRSGFSRRNANLRKDVIDLQIAPLADGMIAASRSGIVSGYMGESIAWQYNAEDVITGGVGIDDQGSVAVIGTRSGKLIALDARTGAPRWAVELASSSLTPALISGDKVIVITNSGTIFGLDINSGATVWQYATQVPNTSVRGMAKPLALDARTVLIGGADGRIHALDTMTGAPVWTRRVGLAMGSGEIDQLRDIDGTPTVVDHYLYAASYSGQLTGFDMTTGRTMFVSELSSTKKLTTLADAVIGSSTDGDVVAFNRLTGEKLWENHDLKYRGLTNPVTIGTYIAVGDADGVVHILNHQGQIISRANTKGALTNLTVINHRLYAQSADGVVTVWQF